MGDSALLTIIICTYNRAKYLELCLDSLMNCLQLVEYCEVLVVDNNSTDDTRAIAESYAGKLPLRYVFEARQGLSHARNRGLAEARTDWLAFLDDDAKARPDWVSVILATMNKGDFDAFGGPYYAWHHFGPPPEWYPDSLGTYEPTQDYGPLDNSRAYIPGGNCALRVAPAKVAGGFPPELGMSGAKNAYGEETALFYAMADKGGRLGYVPDMKIDHCVLPYKYSLFWLLKSYFSRGKANVKVVTPPLVWKTVATHMATFGFYTARALYRAGRGLLRGMDAKSRKDVVARAIYASFALGQAWASFQLTVRRKKRP